MTEGNDDYKKTSRTVSRIFARVASVYAAHSKAKAVLEQAKHDKATALDALLDAVANGRKKLGTLKKANKPALKAALKAPRKGKTPDTKLQYTKLLLSSAPCVTKNDISKYSQEIEHAMKNAEEGQSVSEFIREKGGIRKVDETIRKENKRKKRGK